MNKLDFYFHDDLREKSLRDAVFGRDPAGRHPVKARTRQRSTEISRIRRSCKSKDWMLDR
jgi:hypothetical protein